MRLHWRHKEPAHTDQPVKNYLIVTALGEDTTGLVTAITQTVAEAGCNVVDSRMAVMGGDFTLCMMVHGNWSTLAKLETQLKRLEGQLGLTVATRRSEGHRRAGDVMPYAAEVIAPDQPGIVHGLANFFSSRSINIEEMVCRRYNAPHTGTPMFSVNLVVGIPTSLHIAVLREEFMDYCDRLNLDAVMEPVKA